MYGRAITSVRISGGITNEFPKCIFFVVLVNETRREVNVK